MRILKYFIRKFVNKQYFVKSKFNLGEKVYVLMNGQVKHLEITEITIIVNFHSYIVGYQFWNEEKKSSYPDKYKEYKCFKTKEELLNSL